MSRRGFLKEQRVITQDEYVKRMPKNNKAQQRKDESILVVEMQHILGEKYKDCKNVSYFFNKPTNVFFQIERVLRNFLMDVPFNAGIS